MRRAVAVFLALVLLAGCPQEEKGEEYSIDSLAIESRDHVFTKDYNIYVKLSENAFGSGHSLKLYQDRLPLAEHLLDYPEAPEGREIAFLWPAIFVGDHELMAVIESLNGTEVSGRKTLPVSVEPFGYYDFSNIAMSHPLESGVWCAQPFKIEHDSPISEAWVHLRSMVLTKKNKVVALEIRNTTPEGLPREGNESVIAGISIYSRNVKTEPAWYSFSISKEIPAGNYWLVMRRDDDVGNVGWTYSDEAGANGGICRDLAISNEWVPVHGKFAFRLE